MALQHLRSSTANKRPTPAAMSDGQLAMNTNLASPGLFFKDSNGDSIKIGPVHVGTTAPNATPGAGGQAGNSVGEAWLDTTAANPILKVFNGSAFVAVQPVGTGTVVSTTDTGTVTSTMILDGTILNADINASAGIVDTKLATIATAGKVSNSATTATNANTASAIVARDASGNFTAGTITAALTGAASSNVLKAGDTMTGALAVPLASAATPSLTFTGDLNTGVFSPGADQVAISTNGVARLTTSTTAVSSSLAVDHPLGAVGTPSITFTGDLNTGFFSPAADTLAAVTAGSNRLHITSGGLVGIGNSVPRGIIHVGADLNSGAADAAAINLKQTSTTAATGIYLERAAERKGYYIYLGGDGDSLNFQRNNTGTKSDVMTLTREGLVGIGTTNPATTLNVQASAGEMIRATVSSNIGLYANIGADGNGGWFGSNADLRLLPSGTERARIDTSGRLLVGTSSWSGSSSNVGGLQIQSANYVAGGQVTERLGSWRASASDNNGGCEVGIDFFRRPRGGGVQSGSEIRFFTGFTYLGGTFQRMTIDQNGTITFNAYGAGTLSTDASGVISASDGRYKTKTRQLESGLNVIAALQPTYYRWNEDSPFESEHEELGFVAQEVAAVIPEASPGKDEEGKYRNYHDRAIIAMLVKGMQEQQSIITALTARVAALEAN